MPQIIVTADGEHGRGESTVTLRERINASDFECQTFGHRLIERLGWAVNDAHDAEQREPDPELEQRAPEPELEQREPEGQPRPSANVLTTAS